MEFKQEQLTTISRYKNSIEAAKITNIQGSNLTIERFNGQAERFPVSYMCYEVGQYVDIQYFKNGNSSHTLKLVGHTPPQFCPDAGASA